MFFRGCLAGAALSLLPLVSAQAEEPGIRVIMNQAKIVKLSRPADTIVVGNPAIADAAIQDAKTVVLTGRGFGTTNFVVMDAEGNAIVDELVMVSRGETNALRIYRRTEFEDLSCTPNCETAFNPVAGASAPAPGQ